MVATRPLKPDGQPLVVSRSQVLVSDLDVIARVRADSGEVTVREVLYPKEEETLRGRTLEVTNLKDCGPVEPGSYLLPLRRSPAGKKDAYEVTPTPPTSHLSHGESGRTAEKPSS